MILVDTSVLINYLRGKESAGANYLSNVIEKSEPKCLIVELSLQAKRNYNQKHD